MADKLKQSNIFGSNLINSTFTKHRKQGFIAGLFLALMTYIIIETVVKPLL